MDAAALIRVARQTAGLNQKELAERAGVSREVLSHYERARRIPTITTLQAILAAAGHQIHAELEPLDADVHKAIEAVSRTPMEDRDGVFGWGQLERADEFAHRVEGLAAASILGAPVPVGTFELAMADEQRTYQWLYEQMLRWAVKLRVPAWSYFDVIQTSADSVRETIGTECPDGRFELQSCLTFATVRLAPPDEVARHVLVKTRLGTIPVQPLHEIEATDPAAARTLRVMREYSMR
jgi:transcriptional regulator with XRE-family HTH domain